jgi:hypothetical protein
LRHVFGLRFLAEAVFIVLVTAVVWYEDVPRAGIFGSIAAAWFLVALAEWALSLRRHQLPHLVEPANVTEPAPARAPVRGPPAEPERPREPVALPPAKSVPRVWNVWDLERKARESAGADTARDEERSFLLMYLREFAAADGVLPVEFDPLVRETFGGLVETALP